MGYLLDTHILLWWLTDHPRLGGETRAVLENPAHMIHVSAASAWEISIKRALGRITIEDEVFSAGLSENGFHPLAIAMRHALAAGALPPHHRDPFDRMLIAQANVEELTLVTGDRTLTAYDGAFMWV